MGPLSVFRLMPVLLVATAACFLRPATLRAADEVRVCVVAILATDQNTTIDPKLRCIAKEVQKQEPALTGFKISTTHCKPLAVGAKESFTLVEGETATIVVAQGFDKDNRVRLCLKAPTLGEVMYTTCCGKYFPLITRYETKDKSRLILAVMVRSPDCKGK